MFMNVELEGITCGSLFEGLGQIRKLCLWYCQVSGQHLNQVLFECLESALVMRQAGEWNGECSCICGSFLEQLVFLE